MLIFSRQNLQYGCYHLKYCLFSLNFNFNGCGQRSSLQCQPEFQQNQYQYPRQPAIHFFSTKKSNKSNNKNKQTFLKNRSSFLSSSEISTYYRLITPDSRVDVFLSSLTKYNRTHLVYYAPRLVFIIWGIAFAISGLYLLKQSFTTEGFTRQYKPGEGGDVGKEDWNLMDMHGNKVYKDDFLGKYTLLYFGFTFCPDVCPIEMQKLADLSDILSEKGLLGTTIVPIFVSVDYKRDSPKVVLNYVKQYSDKVLGLCGTRVQLEHFARCMKTYFSRPPDLEEDYILEHSTYMYFTGKDGAFKQLTSTDDGPQVLANKVCKWIAEDEGKVPLWIEKVKQFFHD